MLRRRPGWPAGCPRRECAGRVHEGSELGPGHVPRAATLSLRTDRRLGPGVVGPSGGSFFSARIRRALRIPRLRFRAPRVCRRAGFGRCLFGRCRFGGRRAGVYRCNEHGIDEYVPDAQIPGGHSAGGYDRRWRSRIQTRRPGAFIETGAVRIAFACVTRLSRRIPAQTRARHRLTQLRASRDSREFSDLARHGIDALGRFCDAPRRHRHRPFPLPIPASMQPIAGRRRRAIRPTFRRRRDAPGAGRSQRLGPRLGPAGSCATP